MNSEYKEIVSMLLNITTLYDQSGLIPQEDQELKELCCEVQLTIERASELAVDRLAERKPVLELVK